MKAEVTRRNFGWTAALGIAAAPFLPQARAQQAAPHHPRRFRHRGRRALARRGFAARTGIRVTLASRCSGRLPDETGRRLFRIAQEALTNVARHDAARRVEVKLESGGGEIRLTMASPPLPPPKPGRPRG